MHEQLQVLASSAGNSVKSDTRGNFPLRGRLFKFIVQVSNMPWMTRTHMRTCSRDKCRLIRIFSFLGLRTYKTCSNGLKSKWKKSQFCPASYIDHRHLDGKCNNLMKASILLGERRITRSKYNSEFKILSTRSDIIFKINVSELLFKFLYIFGQQKVQ